MLILLNLCVVLSNTGETFTVIGKVNSVLYQALTKLVPPVPNLHEDPLFHHVTKSGPHYSTPIIGKLAVEGVAVTRTIQFFI